MIVLIALTRSPPVGCTSLKLTTHFVKLQSRTAHLLLRRAFHRLRHLARFLESLRPFHLLSLSLWLDTHLRPLSFCRSVASALLNELPFKSPPFYTRAFAFAPFKDTRSFSRRLPLGRFPQTMHFAFSAHSFFASPV